MGLKCACDFVQQIMDQVLHGLNNVEVYLDGIDVFNHSWDKYQVLLNFLSCLEANCFTVNPLKCAWAIQENNWLR